MAEQVRVSGAALLTRAGDGESGEAEVTLNILLTARDALVRIGDGVTGRSQFRGFTHPVSIWTLTEIDKMIEAIMYANRPITTRFKGDGETVTRSADLLPPPRGYRWCPACLGCLNRSQTCLVCDGQRVVKAGH